MVYIVGILGFISGFALGLLILKHLLKDRSAEELLASEKLKWTYGLFNWLIAGLGAYSAVVVYKMYFS